MSANEDRIREFAYQIWESEGKPNGHAKRHWEMARKLVEAEKTPGKTPAAKRASKPKAPADTAAPAKPRARKPVAPVEAEIPVLPTPSKSKANASKTTAAKPVAKKPKV